MNKIKMENTKQWEQPAFSYTAGRKTERYIQLWKTNR